MLNKPNVSARYFSLLAVVAILLGASSSFGQSGCFVEASHFFGVNSCQNQEDTYEIKVELDDFPAGVDFILRKVVSDGQHSVCPSRPVAGKTVLHGAKNPEAFEVSSLDLTIKLKTQLLLSGTSICSANGLQEEGMLCLYAKQNAGTEINLVAQTKYRVNTVKHAPRPAKKATSAEEIALIRACEVGNLALAKDLLSKGVETEVESEHGWRPLHIASWNGNVGLVKLLIENGAALEAKVDRQEKESDPRIAKFPHYFDLRTPLQFAAYRDQVNVATLLLEFGALVEEDASKCREMPPLGVAAREGNIAVMELLLQWGANPNKETSHNCRTPINCALQFCDLDKCEIVTKAVQLLHSSGASLDARADGGRSVLHIAQSRCLNAVKYFLSLKMDPNIRDDFGRTPIHITTDSEIGRATTMALLESGADIEARSSSQMTPIFQKPCPEIGYGQGPDVYELFLKNNANVNAQDIRGNTRLHYAGSFCEPEIAKVLIKYSANPHLLNQEKETPLDLARKSPCHAFKGNRPELLKVLEAAVKKQK